ncbi:NAD(P)-dependent oxidoreductase [Aspergillus homomorphus CBS 101889]|uniref:NAD(P)-binding protein n=1 Tax=Aspergillus homomorphus (strain CBS 101889) TaxID=1450537 RepID=A0A395I3M9_ASPHC|nr:hypothetical protein BO97DRAFT_422582 [Aspergillus homomorphus CBS 101889]RAL14690.1 hypothetical protein BO97DRAFT_422582 [Aspergillus homomorphus CBS 101889]
MSPKLAWIGLGNMGRGMAANLATKGPQTQPLIIHNRTQTTAQTFAQNTPNTTVSATLEATLTQADIIFTCLSDDAAITTLITAAVTTPNLSLHNKIFVDCSTVHPSTTTTISKQLNQAGAQFIACPVFGSPAAAAAGQVICVLAGEADVIERIKPYTTGVIAKSDLEFADCAPAKASQLKILGNTFVISMVEAIAEGLVVAEKCGLGAENLHRFFEAVFPGPYVAYSERMRSGDYWRREAPLFGVGLVRKDARHALDMAHSVGARMRGVELADGYLRAVEERTGEKGDLAGVYGAVREEGGLKFEN